MKLPVERRMPPTRKPSNTGGRPRQRDVGEIRHGTVGWEDGNDHFDLEAEGVPFIKVTLFAGYNTETQGQNTNPKRAKGLHILARFDGRASDIPDDGEHVIVARPADMETTPGSYYIIGRTMPDPKWTPNRKSGEKIIFGPNDSFIRFKQDGTIFLFCKSGDADTGKPVQIELGPQGFQVDHPHGRLRADEIGFEMSHSSGASISGNAVGGIPGLDMVNSLLTLRAAAVRIDSMLTSFGPSDAAPDALLKATPLLGVLSSQQAALTAISTALNALIADVASAAAAPAVPYVPSATVPIGAAVSAVASAATALTTGSADAPTRSIAGG